MKLLLLTLTSGLLLAASEGQKAQLASVVPTASKPIPITRTNEDGLFDGGLRRTASSFSFDGNFEKLKPLEREASEYPALGELTTFRANEDRSSPDSEGGSSLFHSFETPQGFLNPPKAPKELTDAEKWAALPRPPQWEIDNYLAHMRMSRL